MAHKDRYSLDRRLSKADKLWRIYDNKLLQQVAAYKSRSEARAALRTLKEGDQK